MILAVFNLALTCFRGLADVLAAEVAELFQTPIQPRILNDGLVMIESQGSSSAAMLALAKELAEQVRTARHVLRLLYAGKVESLAHLVSAIDGLPYDEVLNGDQSFGVLCDRWGQHDFTSEDVGREVGSAIRRRFRTSGGAVPAVKLRHPEQQVLAYLHADVFHFGLDLCGPLDERRRYSKQQRTSLNPALAAALVRLADVRSASCLLDPMAGGGTIPLEAAAIAAKYGQSLRLIAGEERHATFSGLQQNIVDRGMAGRIEAVRGDAATLAYLAHGECPLVVTDPPYGMREAVAGGVDELYQRFAHAAREKGVGKVVAITPRKHAWLAGFEQAGYRLSHVRSVRYGHMETWVMIHQLGLE